MSRSNSFRLLTTTALITGLGALAGSAHGQFVFDPTVHYATGQRPDGVAAADFDGDGDADLALTTDGNGNQDLVEFFMNNGDGTYSPGAVFFLPRSSSPGAIQAADFDGDGDADLAVVLRDLNQVQMLINGGTGAFASGSSASIGSNGRGLAQGDIEGDGDIDLIVANRDSNTATVMVNSGSASFSSTTLTAGDEPRAAAFFDIDSDGLLDAAVTNHRGRSVSLYHNSGAASFSGMGTLSTGGQLRPEGITSADLNGDGRADLAVATNGNALNFASVWLNLGGSFGGRIDYASGGQNTSSIVAADLNCDGMIDLATRNKDSNNISMLPNVGGGAYGAAQLFAVGSQPDHIIAHDLDGDGVDDIAVTNKSSNSVSVLINQCQAASQAAALTDVTRTLGIYVSGSVAELVASDDTYYVLQSGPGFDRTEPHPARMDCGFDTGGFSASTLNVTVEERSNIGGPTGVVLLRNWATGQWDEIDRYAVSPTDETHMVTGVAAGDYINGSSRVEVRVRSFAILVLDPSVRASFSHDFVGLEMAR